jgi:hypothetical protein
MAAKGDWTTWSAGASRAHSGTVLLAKVDDRDIIIWG